MLEEPEWFWSPASCCSGLGAAFLRLPPAPDEETSRLSLELLPRSARRLSASVLCFCFCDFDFDAAVMLDSTVGTLLAAAAAAANRLDEDVVDEDVEAEVEDADPCGAPTPALSRNMGVQVCGRTPGPSLEVFSAGRSAGRRGPESCASVGGGGYGAGFRWCRMMPKLDSAAVGAHGGMAQRRASFFLLRPLQRMQLRRSAVAEGCQIQRVGGRLGKWSSQRVALDADEVRCPCIARRPHHQPMALQRRAPGWRRCVLKPGLTCSVAQLVVCCV